MSKPNKEILELTKNNLIKAQEEYLFARGWKKVGEKHYTPNKKVSWVDPGDQLFLNNALEAQLYSES